MTPEEQAQLRALICAAPDEAFDWDAPESRELAEQIVAWHHARPIVRGDLDATRRLARVALAAELERQQRLPSVDELVQLLRRTSVSHNRKGVADDAA